MTKVFTIAHMSQKLAQAWLQHLRDFDTAHPGCHFEVAAEAPNATLAEVVRALTIEPSLTVTAIFERAQAQAATFEQGLAEGVAFAAAAAQKQFEETNGASVAAFLRALDLKDWQP